MRPLDDHDRAILAFEQQPWRTTYAKDQAIREQFGISPTRYRQRLAQLVDNPAALEAHPVLLGRLRRIRDQRAARIHLTKDTSARR